MEFLDVFYCIFTLLIFLVLVCFAGTALIQSIGDALSKRKSEEAKHYDKLKRVLQKSIQKIGSRDTIQNLRIAFFHVDGLEELRKQLIEREEFKEKNLELELELGEKNIQIARLEDELEKSRLKSMEIACLGEVAEKAKAEKRGKGKK